MSSECTVPFDIFERLGFQRALLVYVVDCTSHIIEEIGVREIPLFRMDSTVNAR